MDVLGGTVMKGFEKYFAGCGIKADGTRPADSASVTVPGKTLYQSLKDISYKHGGTVKDLIVTGHSMGSTTAQLTGALACKEGWFERVIVSCSASPRFGTAGFKTWYDQLRSEKPHHMLILKYQAPRILKWVLKFGLKKRTAMNTILAVHIHMQLITRIKHTIQISILAYSRLLKYHLSLSKP
jgi:hypothetical protein